MDLLIWFLLLVVHCDFAACLEQPGFVQPAATLLGRNSSSSALTATGDFLSEIPACGAKCYSSALSIAQCSDAAGCICSNQTFFEQSHTCIRAACEFAQQLVTRNATEAFCKRPPRDRSTQYNATSISLCVVTGLLVITRLLFKLFFSLHKALQSDDWVILISILVGLPCTILNVVGLTDNGLGKDIWTLLPSEIVDFARYFFIQQILYIFLMTTIKLSLLCFYLTIFPGRRVRMFLWFTLAITLAFGAAFTVLSVVQCTPIRFYWMQYVQETNGSCININLMGWVNGAGSVIIDLWMIGIPLSQIQKLELHWKKKVGAGVMFLIGTFVTVVSILRLQSLLFFYSSENATWDLWQTAWWSTIEVNVGLICACLPTIRLILVRMWPRVFASTLNGSLPRSRLSRESGMMMRGQQVRLPSIEMQPKGVPVFHNQGLRKPSLTPQHEHLEKYQL